MKEERKMNKKLKIIKTFIGLKLAEILGFIIVCLISYKVGELFFIKREWAKKIVEKKENGIKNK